MSLDTALKVEVRLKFGELKQACRWLDETYHDSEWEFTVIDSAGSSEGTYLFSFTNSDAATAFTLRYG